MLRNLGTTAGLVAVLLAAIVIAEMPQVRSLAAWIDAREPRLLVGVAVTITLGLVLFFIGIVKLLMDRGEPLTRAEVEDAARSVHLERRPVLMRASRYRVRGAAAGRGGADQFSLRELKKAWGCGALWRDSMWRRRAVATVGALLLIAGAFCALVVIGPAWLKVLGTGAFAFTFGMLGLGLARS